MASSKNKKKVNLNPEVSLNLVEEVSLNPVEEPVQDKKSGNLDNSDKKSGSSVEEPEKSEGSVEKSGKISASALPPIPARIQRIFGGPRTGKFAVIVGRETLAVCSRVEAWNMACDYNESKGLPRECQMSL